MIGIDIDQLRLYIIEPVLKQLNMYSDAAINLMLGTAAQESGCGHYIHQIKGPALGIYQMEPATHDDIWNNFIAYHPNYKYIVELYLSTHNVSTHNSDEIIWNLKYATAMCRLKYFRVPKKLPEANDIIGLATYWKNYYNTEKGKGTISAFIHNYNKYIV